MEQDVSNGEMEKNIQANILWDRNRDLVDINIYKVRNTLGNSKMENIMGWQYGKIILL